MEIPKEKTVSFISDHSEKNDSVSTDKNLLNVLYAELYHIITKLYKQGYTHYCSGMSEGVDLLAANAVLDFKEEHPDVRFVAVIPFKGQQEQYYITNKNDYQYMCTEADEVVILAEEFTGNDLYRRCNDYLLEHCSHVVCCYEQTDTYNRSEKVGLPISNLYDRLAQSN